VTTGVTTAGVTAALEPLLVDPLESLVDPLESLVAGEVAALCLTGAERWVLDPDVLAVNADADVLGLVAATVRVLA